MPKAKAAAARDGKQFAKSLGLFEAMSLGIGNIVGSGIFLFPIVMGGIAGTYSLIAWTIGGIYTILAGLCFAENAVREPKAGGLYSYSYKAFGEKIGFVTGWSYWIGYCATMATEAKALSVYSKYFLPGLMDFERLLFALGVILVLLAINYFGVKGTGIVEDVFTFGKLIPLIIFILVGIFLVNTQNYFPLAPVNVNLPSAVGIATVLALWAYLGIDNITVPMEEIKNGQRTVPRAIIITVILVTVVYLGVCSVALGVTKYQPFQSSGTPLADIMQTVVKGVNGNILGGLMILGGTLAIVGSANVIILGAPRISLALSKDGLFPKIFDRLHPKHKTPTFGIIAEGITGISVLILVADLESLANLAVLFTVFPYFLSCLATVQLIREDKWKTKIIKTRWIAVFASIMSIGLFAYFGLNIVLIALGLFALSIPVYLARRKKTRRRTEA